MKGEIFWQAADGVEAIAGENCQRAISVRIGSFGLSILVDSYLIIANGKKVTIVVDIRHFYVV